MAPSGVRDNDNSDNVNYHKGFYKTSPFFVEDKGHAPVSVTRLSVYVGCCPVCVQITVSSCIGVCIVC